MGVGCHCLIRDDLRVCCESTSRFVECYGRTFVCMVREISRVWLWVLIPTTVWPMRAPMASGDRRNVLVTCWPASFWMITLMTLCLSVARLVNWVVTRLLIVNAGLLARRLIIVLMVCVDSVRLFEIIWWTVLVSLVGFVFPSRNLLVFVPSVASMALLRLKAASIRTCMAVECVLDWTWCAVLMLLILGTWTLTRTRLMVIWLSSWIVSSLLLILVIILMLGIALRTAWSLIWTSLRLLVTVI